MSVSGDFPPFAGTPLFTAAAKAAWPSSRPRAADKTKAPTIVVLLDGNQVSAAAVAGQGALAGLGEAALFRGCVLPETVASTKALNRGAFWEKTRTQGVVGGEG